MRSCATRWRPWVVAGALLACAPGTAQAEDAPICTDRPAKANAVCTVPAGTVQIETSAVAWSLVDSAGSRTETLAIGASVLKIGVSNSADLQLGFIPYLEVTAKRPGARDRLSGFGDLMVRYKQRLTRVGAPVQVAAIPFVKLPTAARLLGNGKVEGGLAVPVSLTLAGPVTMTLGPELDLLADFDGHGHHLAAVNLVNLSGPVAERLTLSGEFWTSFNFDPAGTVRQASLDAALAYALSNDLQLDGGVNLGLTRATPDVELYAGLSVRL